MTYLIALIIAIALGAVIALLSFTNIGSGFSGQSEKAQVQVFAGAASQIEIALAAYDASGGNVADSDFQDNFQSDLQTAAWLRTDLQRPGFASGDYALVNSSNGNGLDLTLPITTSCDDLDLSGFENSSLTCFSDGEHSGLVATVY